jgi:hypothetical protein
METTFQYLRQFGPLLAERILETYPPLQNTKDPVAPRIATLLRKALPAQALAITGTAVIDGVIYDTPDCSRGGTRCVYGYFSLSDQPTPANVLWQRTAA